jgi:8-hydroxy-5-deazaflavin:NADPH oxidoreductase
MEIAVIGAGFIGGTLARHLAAAGHRVRIANSRAPSTLAEFEDEEGITPRWATEALDGADVAILAIPQRGVTSLPEAVVSALSNVPVVVDTGNYYPARDGRIAAIDQGMTDSQWVAQHLGRPVFKVFNNIAAPSLKHKATHSGQRLGLTVAGPATGHKQTVLELVHEIGFEPLDAGDLDESWRLQPGTPTYCKDMTAEQLRHGLAATTREDIGQYQASRDEVDFSTAVQRMSDRM